MASSLLSMGDNRGARGGHLPLYFLHLYTLVSTPKLAVRGIAPGPVHVCAESPLTTCAEVHTGARGSGGPRRLKLRPQADSVLDESHKEADREGEELVVEVEVRVVASRGVRVFPRSEEEIGPWDLFCEPAEVLCGRERQTFVGHAICTQK